MSKKSPLTPATAPAAFACVVSAEPCAILSACSRSVLTAGFDRFAVST